jgi:hypothetical protein
MSKGPTITVLCGSTRFYDAFRAENLRLTLADHIVLSIGCDTKSDGDLDLATAGGATLDEVKARLDALHLAKIDLADEVFVLNVGGYIGDSTRREIDYAESLGKPVHYLEPVPPPTPDEPTEPGAYLIGDVPAMRWKDTNYAWSWQRSTNSGKAIIFRGTWGAVDGVPGANLVADLNLSPDVTIRRMVAQLTDDTGKPLDTISDWVNCDDGQAWLIEHGWVPAGTMPAVDEGRLYATFVRIIQIHLIAGTIHCTTPSAKNLAHELVQVVNERGRANDIPERVSASAETPTPDRVDLITQVLAAHDIGVQLQRGKWAWVCHGRPSCGSASAYEHAWPNDALAAGRSHIAEQIDKALQLAATGE